MDSGDEADVPFPARHGVIDRRAVAQRGTRGPGQRGQLRPAPAEAGQQLRAGDTGHGRPVADGHHLDEPHLQGLVLCQSGQRFQLALVHAHLGHAVQLDRNAAFQRGMDARLHGGKFIPGRDLCKQGGVQRIQTDVHAVQPGLQQGGQLLFQQDGIGGHGDLPDAGDGFQPLDQLLYALAHQRFAAGDPHGIHPAPGKQGGKAQEFFVGQDILPFQLVHAVRHTVAAAQVAQVGHGKAEIMDIAALGIKHSRPPPGYNVRSCRRSFPPDGSRPAPCPYPQPCTCHRW